MITWFEVGGALVWELHGHAAIDTGDRRAIDKHTQARLTKSLEGIAAGISWWDGAKRSHCCPAWHKLNEC